LAITAGGRTGQVGDVGEERDPFGLRQQRGDQRPGVEELSLVGMVLDPHKGQPAPVRDPRELAVTLKRIGVRDDRDPDLGHSSSA
jgi:hypothetical protein